jgi:hypothetical protein
MHDPANFFAARVCLLPPLPEHDTAANLLSRAADALLAGNVPEATKLLNESNLAPLGVFANRLLKKVHPSILRWRAVSSPGAPRDKTRRRMPGAAVTRALHVRDGWRCRYCRCRVVFKSARDVMRRQLPDALPWSKEYGYHAAFLALTASVDHVLPASGGGGLDLENLVTACWPCQFGRTAYSLEELGLIDPRATPPILDKWDGLCRLVDA